MGKDWLSIGIGLRVVPGLTITDSGFILLRAMPADLTIAHGHSDDVYVRVSIRALPRVWDDWMVDSCMPNGRSSL